MQLRALGACVVLAACQPSVPQTHPEPGQPPASRAATTVTNLDKAHPQAALQRFEQQMQAPLVSKDGSLVALSNRFVRTDTPPAKARDLKRNHVLAIVDVTKDRTTSRVAYPLSPDDSTAVSAALAKAQTLLAKHEWEPLKALTIVADEQWPARTHGLGTTMPQMGGGAGLTVQFHEPELRVRGPKGQQILTAKLASWSTPPGGSHGCLVHTDLAQAWVSRRHGVLAVEVAFGASPHHCDFAPALHVVRFATPATGKAQAPAGGTGARCTVTDSNGPLPGGERKTRGCGADELCHCEARAGYSCSGTCRPASSLGKLGGSKR